MKAVKLLFVVAKMLAAICAAKAGIAILKVALGIKPSTDFPSKQQQQRHTNENKSQRMWEENERSKHHNEVPVIDTAAATAFVEHHPALEGAEKEYAYHVTDGVSQRN